MIYLVLPIPGADLGSFGFHLFSISRAAPLTTRLLHPHPSYKISFFEDYKDESAAKPEAALGQTWRNPDLL